MQQPNRPQPKTSEDLRKIATDLGVSRDRVKSAFAEKGLSGSFDPTKFDDYVAVLMVEAKRDKAVELLRTKINEMEAANALPCCPVCGSTVVRAPKWDRFFRRDPRGWKCSQGGLQHFLTHNMQGTYERLAEKWKFLDELGQELSSGKITQEQYYERISKRWEKNPDTQTASTSEATSSTS